LGKTVKIGKLAGSWSPIMECFIYMGDATAQRHMPLSRCKQHKKRKARGGQTPAGFRSEV